LNATGLRMLRVPLVAAIVTAVLAVVAPIAMSRYDPYLALRGLGSGCTAPFPSAFIVVRALNQCTTVAEMYRRPFLELLPDAAMRSVVLIVGAGVLALVVGGGLGVALALARRRVLGSAGLVAIVSVFAAVPSFFVAYSLQMAVIVAGAGDQGGHLLPVFGFGYDEHLVLPTVSLAIPAIAFTTQITAARMQEVLDAEFVTTANAKGLRPSWIIAVHVLPHVRPAVVEGLGTGLRVSVASLPIIETLFNWNGIGAIGLQAIALRDAPAFVFCAFVLAAGFGLLGAIADLSRPRSLYRA